MAGESPLHLWGRRCRTETSSHGRAGPTRLSDILHPAIGHRLLRKNVNVTLDCALADWTDWDLAAYALGHATGLFKEESFGESKGLFWTDNTLGNNALLALVAAGILERRDEPDEQFRWKA